jgi:hypothetical protein
MQFSSPAAVSRLLAAKKLYPLVVADFERYKALERAGFKVAYHHLNERQYVDVGTSAKIASGLVSFIHLLMRSRRTTADSLTF